MFIQVTDTHDSPWRYDPLADEDAGENAWTAFDADDLASASSWDDVPAASQSARHSGSNTSSRRRADAGSSRGREQRWSGSSTRVGTPSPRNGRNGQPTTIRTSAAESEASWPVPAAHTSWPQDAQKPKRTSGHPSSLFPWLSWKFSLILPVAVLLALATLVWSNTSSTKAIDLSIVDAQSGQPISGALVQVGDVSLQTSENGTVSFDRPEAATALQVSAEGYAPFAANVTESTGTKQQLMLRPNTMSGTLVDESTGEPIAGASVTLLAADGTELSSTATDDNGAYQLVDVPENGQLVIDAGRYGTSSHDLSGQVNMDLALAITTASGLVLDDAGEPLQGAIIRSGDVTTITAGDGTYTLDGVANGADVIIQASGFESASATVSDGVIADAQLSRQMIKAVYANVNLLRADGGLESLIEIANTTEINAIVIDVKEGAIFYDSNVQFFDDAGTIRPTYDLDAILQQLEENDIYAIARMVVFQDPIVAEARPDLAVHDLNGGLWRNIDGVAWVSAFHEELWDANIALAVELAERGFDEVQYDYVRFPSDGDLNTADFGQDYTAEAREAAITEFMRRSHEAVNGAGAFLAADLFGFVTIQDDEQWIGQRFSALEPHLDFVCMMIYPSHFETGNIASAPGHPNDYPYETIFESLERAEAIVPGSSLKFRPWLQDFSYGFAGLRDYTDEDVRAQIEAAEDFGASGWMLWGDPMDVSVGALEPDPDAGS